MEGPIRRRSYSERGGLISRRLYRLFQVYLKTKQLPTQGELLDAEFRFAIADSVSHQKNRAVDRFISWARKMYLADEGYLVHVDAQKTILAHEDYMHLVMNLHTRGGQSGTRHRGVGSIVTEVYNKYSFVILHVQYHISCIFDCIIAVLKQPRESPAYYKYRSSPSKCPGALNWDF